MELRGFLFGELMRPGDAARWVRTGARAVELRVECLGRAGSFIPRIPSLRSYIATEFRVDVNNSGVRTPWAAKTRYLF